MLTDRHVVQFETLGFVVLRGVLDARELDTARAEFEAGLARAAAATERRGIRKQLNWSNLGPDTPFLGSLLEDSRFVAAARRLCGGEVVGYYANSNSFDGDRTEWHPDTSRLLRRSLKVAFYLQPLDELSGALRFIPGSHKQPLHSDIRKIGIKEANHGILDSDGLEVDEVPAYVARSSPGDAIVFDSRVWHATWGGGRDRRMCSLGYFAAPVTPAEEEAMPDLVREDAELLKAFPLLARPAHWVANPVGSRERERWIRSLRGWGFAGVAG
jgi:ectoine hydroxylase-related dioxygenase (phytanoyl-CoA dioxygenase family)